MTRPLRLSPPKCPAAPLRAPAVRDRTVRVSRARSLLGRIRKRINKEKPARGGAMRAEANRSRVSCVVAWKARAEIYRASDSSSPFAFLRRSRERLALYIRSFELHKLRKLI